MSDETRIELREKSRCVTNQSLTITSAQRKLWSFPLQFDTKVFDTTTHPLKRKFGRSPATSFNRGSTVHFCSIFFLTRSIRKKNQPSLSTCLLPFLCFFLLSFGALLSFLFLFCLAFAPSVSPLSCSFSSSLDCFSTSSVEKVNRS